MRGTILSSRAALRGMHWRWAVVARGCHLIVALEAAAKLQLFPHRAEPQALAGGLQVAVGVRKVHHRLPLVLIAEFKLGVRVLDSRDGPPGLRSG